MVRDLTLTSTYPAVDYLIPRNPPCLSKSLGQEFSGLLVKSLSGVTNLTGDQFDGTVSLHITLLSFWIAYADGWLVRQCFRSPGKV